MSLGSDETDGDLFFLTWVRVQYPGKNRIGSYCWLVEANAAVQGAGAACVAIRLWMKKAIRAQVMHTGSCR